MSGLTNMNPAWRVVLVVVGTALGAKLSANGATLLGASLGALAGLGLGETISLRDAIQKLRAELSDVRTQELTRQAHRDAQARGFAPPQAAGPVTQPAPATPLPSQAQYTLEPRAVMSAAESTPLGARSEGTRPGPDAMQSRATIFVIKVGGMPSAEAAKNALVSAGRMLAKH